MRNLIITTVLVLTAMFTNAQDSYRVTAQTNKQYGQNYAIDIYIKGTPTSQYSSAYIGSAYYKTTYGDKVVYPTSEYGYKNTYKVYIDGNYYYFQF